MSYARDEEKAGEILSVFCDAYKKIVDREWNLKNLETVDQRVISEKNYTPKEAFMSVRVAVTGLTATPSLVEILELLGKKETVERIEKSISALR
jgi:glutamyl/glutaminyl-tRNA synthetase